MDLVIFIAVAGSTAIAAISNVFIQRERYKTIRYAIKKNKKRKKD